MHLPKRVRRGHGATPAGPNAALVLIVDDVEDNREMYAEFLRFAGFRVASAVDGVDGFEKAQALRPDVVVMDVSLPRLDGWEVTRRLKARPATRNIPVIALTGHVLGASAQRSRAAGCDAFLTKPCLPDALASAIRAVLAGVAQRGARKVEPS